LKIRYQAQRFTPAQQAVIDTAERFCNDYARQGLSLTLRQLYYRFIATDAFPASRLVKIGVDQGGEPVFTKNHDRNYKWLGSTIADARLDGQIDWNHLEDRTRTANGGDTGWNDPGYAIGSIQRWYNITHWDDQPHYVEVWVEKEALLDVISRPANRWDVVSFAAKGYSSISAMKVAADRIRMQERAGRKSHVLYLGDHDPSGIDMSRDIQDRLNTFRCEADVERLALNMDQVELYDPPPSPVKPGDSRSEGYIERFGTEECWELDALEPTVLDDLIDTAIQGYIDMPTRNERLAQEERDLVVIRAFSQNFELLKDHLEAEDLIEYPEADTDTDESDDGDEDL
jgi:hypothetical protein